jgi:poly(3-hydroxybutyrate) depolymerase
MSRHGGVDPGRAPGANVSVHRGAGAGLALRLMLRLPRQLSGCAPFVLLVALTSVALAQEAAVPPGVQVSLIAKLVSYDKNFAARAGERARILIVTAKGDSDSARTAGQVKAALAETDRVGGVPHDESVTEYTDTEALAKACRDQRAAIVYLMPGLGGEVEAIGRALDGVSVLSVGAVGGYASKGAVIDFFIDGGKPKIALNLAQARKQQVALAPEVIRIMKVIE